MLALRVVEYLDADDPLRPGFFARSVDPSPDPLTLQQVEEALRNRVIMAVPAVAHRVLQIVCPQERRQSMLVNWLPWSEWIRSFSLGLSPPRRHQQRLRHHIRPLSTLHRPADDTMREEIDDHCKIVETLLCADIGGNASSPAQKNSINGRS